MRRLPACLRFRRPAVDRLPLSTSLEPHRAPPARSTRPSSGPRARRALRRRDERAPDPRLERVATAAGGASPTTGRPDAAPRRQLLRAADGRREQRCRSRRPSNRYAAGVDVAPKRVGDREHRLAGASDAARAHQQRRRGPERKATRLHQRLGHRGADTQPGEAAGSVAHREGRDARERDARSREQPRRSSGSSAAA